MNIIFKRTDYPFRINKPGTRQPKVKQMSASFLSNFMRFSLQTTGAERGLACELDLSIVDQMNIEQVDILSESFTGFESMRRALQNGVPIITNNAVMDPALAPVTNTNFSNLRVVVVIPIVNCGAVYLDQSIRRGIIAKDVVEKLAVLGNQALENGYLEITEGELGEMYQQMG